MKLNWKWVVLLLLTGAFACSPADGGKPDKADAGACVPQCDGKTCGDDGCGGSCGTCVVPPSECVDANTARSYANDSCETGQCRFQHTDTSCAHGCQAGRCQGCTPSCTGRECGNDGCGGSCGSCATPPAPVCADGATRRTYSASASCAAGQCAYEHTDAACPYGCANGTCQACQPSCSGRVCGDDGCGGSCGECTITPSPVCLNQTTLRTYTASATCSAGSCAYGYQDASCQYGCSSGRCGTCVASCSGRTCGDDGCGGSCGTCQSPANGQATCSSAGACLLECDRGLVAQNGQCVPNGLQPGSPWPMRGGDPAHRGRSAVVGAQSNRVRWVYKTGIYGVTSSPAIGADGTVYVGSLDFKLYAVKPDGTLKWSYNLLGRVYSSPAIGADGTIYLGTAETWELHAINPNGTLKWSFRAQLEVSSSPAVGVDGTVYVGSADRKLYAINPNGTLKWQFYARGAVYSSPAIGADGTVYVGSEDGMLYAIKPDGTLKWSYSIGNLVNSSPAIGADGTVYVGSNTKKIYAINPNGTLKWSYGTNGVVESSPAIGADGTIYVGSQDTALHAIKPDGTLQWKFYTGGYVNSSPAIGADGVIYFGSTDRKFYAVKPDGTLKWSTNNMISGVESSPAIGADGTVFVGLNSGDVYAFGP